MSPSNNITFYVITAIGVIGVVTSGYLAIELKNQSTIISQLTQTKDNLTLQNHQKDNELAVASTTITELRSELNNLHDDLEDLADDYRNERNRNEEFEDQIRNLAGTIGDLDKLAKTDKELLAKYSKVYFLNENYIPVRLKQIKDKYILAGKGDMYFHTDVMKHLENMLDAADKKGIDLKITSAFRSFETQTDLKGQYTQIYGSGANAFSADQGYSEHQLGTTVDLTTPTVGGTYLSFAETEAYQWLLDNAYKYGFILSYPEDNAFYIFEPWHWRFVGTELARDLHRSDKTFYDMDQREIDKYLINFFN